MPELPEVETIKQVIEPQIQGLKIINAIIKRPEVTAYPTADIFRKRITGQTFMGMSRRGKFLSMHLDSGDQIVLHLRMTGRLLLAPHDYPKEKHTHIIFQLNNGKELRFSDMRRFGRFWLLQQGETDTYTGISKLGFEPFDPEFSAAYLKTKLEKRKKAIKTCLLDQNIVAGIGNIYADEILFAAGIHPARPTNSLNAKEWESLATAIPKRLSYFIEKNKITPEEYLETRGQEYRNTPFLQVYGHADKPCLICAAKLCRTVIGGRSSVYCPVCQKQ